MDISSVAIAAAVLKDTQTLLKAIDAVAPGLGNGPASPVDRFEPRQVIHPEPRYLPRQVLHPTPRYLPRPVLHPKPRVVENAPAPSVKPAPPTPIPWPIPPVWTTLPPTHSQSAPKILKISPPAIDIRNKGTLIDLFI
jgi:hypothetical protein